MTGTTAHLPIQGLDILEIGMNKLNNSQLRCVPEFKGMSEAIGRHYRDLKLAHLTGKAKDLQDKAVQDTKFYNILTKMLCEVERNPTGQRESLQRVYTWYMANKHVLHCGPKFGKDKIKAEAKEILRKAITPRRPARAKSAIERTASGPMLSNRSSRYAASTPKRRNLLTGRTAPPPSFRLDIEHMFDDDANNRFHRSPKLEDYDTTSARVNGAKNQDSDRDGGDESDDGGPVRHSASPSPTRVLARPKTVGSTRFSHRSQFAQQKDNTPREVTPRTFQRMLHPIPCYVNPHTVLAKELSPVDPETLKTHDVPKIISGQLSPSDQLKAWQDFYRSRAIGQDVMGQLKLAGRSGTALDVRYSAHGSGESPELHTKAVVRQLSAKLDHHNTAGSDRLDEENVFVQKTLEQFYEQADNITSDIMKNSPRCLSYKRTKSAPGAKRQNAERKSRVTSAGLSNVPNKVTQGKSSDMTSEQGKSDERVEIKPPTDTGVQLNTVITVIDAVSDDMTFFKEKVAPEPQAGFRQPNSTGLPTPRDTGGSSIGIDMALNSPYPTPRLDESIGNVPRTTPVGDPFPSRTLSLRNDMSSKHGRSMSGRTTPARCKSAGILDWRGRIQPDTLRYKWSKTKFGGHTYLKKWLRPGSRNAGSTTGKVRPKTAPSSTKDRWKTQKESDKNQRAAQAASHGTTEVEQDDVDTMITVQPLLGDAQRSNSMDSLLDMDEAFWRNFRHRSRPESSTEPPTMEFLSFITPSPAALAHQRCKLSTSETEPTEKEETQNLSEGERALSAPIQVPDPSYNVEALDAALQEDRDAGAETQDEHLDSAKLNLQAEEGLDSPQGSKDVEQQTTPRNKTVSSAQVEKNLEIKAVPPSGCHPTPVAERDQPLQELCQSEQWNLSLEGELFNIIQEKLNNKTDHFCDVQLDPPPFGVDPKTMMTTRVQRSAGRMPDQSKSSTCVTSHMLAYSRRYSDALRRAPPLRTPPSIPTPAPSSKRTTSRGGRGPMLSELERHARRARSPRNFMNTVNTLRSEDYDARPTSQATVATNVSNDSVVGMTLQVYKVPNSSRGGRYSQISTDTDFDFNAQLLQSLAEQAPYHSLSREPSMLQSINEGQADVTNIVGMSTGGASSRQLPGSQRTSGQVLRKPMTAPTVDWSRRPQTTAQSGEDLGLYRNSTWTSIGSRPAPGMQGVAIDPRTILVGRPYSKVGRPIAQVSKVPDPDELYQAVIKQKEAAAAVDIQRIFRGYVARNVYKNLLSDEIRRKEEERRAAVKIQSIYRGHMSRQKAIYTRPPLNPELVKWSKDVKNIQAEHSQKRQAKMEALSQEMSDNHRAASQKIASIGPHVEVYDIYHPKKTGPTKKELNQAAIKIQKFVRGWMIRRKMEKLSRKAVWYGSNFHKMVKEYKGMLRRVQNQHGVDKASTPFSISDMNNYIDTRRRYESVFEKKSFGGELEQGDIEAFFKECDLYPSQAEIEDALDVTMRGQKVKREGQGLKKKELLDMIFYIYTPTASGLKGTRQSTWMSPIIEGQEARKLLGSEFVEPAPLAPCAQLVIATKREQRLKEQEQQQAEEKRRISESKGKLMEKRQDQN